MTATCKTLTLLGLGLGLGWDTPGHLEQHCTPCGCAISLRISTISDNKTSHVMPLLMGCQNLIKERGQQHSALESHPKFMTIFWSLLVIFHRSSQKFLRWHLRAVTSSKCRVPGASMASPRAGGRVQCRHSQQELSWEHSEHMTCKHSKLGKKKVKSGVGQLDCARNTGINGVVPSNQLYVNLPEAIKRQGGLIIV